jgi:cytochrome c5
MKRITIVMVVSAMTLSALALIAGAQEEEEPVDPRILAYDKGPAKIDVSKYPPDMKARYKVFVAKCGKCHTPARAINCEFALEDEWERYIKRMMRKAGTFISPDQGKQIFEFVVYDSKIRKKALYEKKLKEAETKPGS